MGDPRRDECQAFVFAHAAAVSLSVGLLCPWFLAMGRFLNRSAAPA